MYDYRIVPAGYTATIYAARADLKPVLFTGLTTEEATQTTDVENYPGYPDGIMGTDMMENFRKQAVRFGTDIRNGIITEIDFSTIPYKVTTEDNVTILCDSVIISTGATAKWLGLEPKRNIVVVASRFYTCDASFQRSRCCHSWRRRYCG